MEKQQEAEGTRGEESQSSDSLNNLEENPWAIVDLVDDGEKWSGNLKNFTHFLSLIQRSITFLVIEMTLKQKLLRILINTTKIIMALGMLYLFVCSLDLLSSSFRLISGKTAGI